MSISCSTVQFEKFANEKETAMKKMNLDTFMDFRMLSSLTYSPDGSKLAYILTGIDREKKEYISRLRLRVGDDDRLMVSDGKT